MILSGIISEKAPNFTWEEVIYSKKGRSLGYANIPDEQTAEHVQHLCENYLQPLRDHLARPVELNSCYRSPAVNRAVGGAPQSFHVKGLAADIRCDNVIEACRMLLFFVERNKDGQYPWHEMLISKNGIKWWLHLAVPMPGDTPKMTTSVSRY